MLCDYTGDTQRQIQQAQQVASDIDDQLESVEESFDLPGIIDDLRQVAQNMDAALQTAQSCASTLITVATGAIALQGANR